VGWNIKNIEKSIDKMESEINGTNLDNELKSRTIENQVKLVAEELKNKMADILVKFSKN
jgi:predicted DNA binding CopG/RHH family protein